MSPAEREQRLQFLNLTDSDAKLLQGLRAFIEPHLPAVVDKLYTHLLQLPEASELLRDRTMIERLKKLQIAYLIRVFEGKFDEPYFEDRIYIGQTHERVGLSPRWYLAAYSSFFGNLAPMVYQHLAHDPDRAQAGVCALEKVFMLDASLAMEAYITSDRYRHLRQLESIVNDSADVIFMLDKDKHVRAWNRAAERILGWSADEVLGRHVKIIIPDDLLKAGELVKIDTVLEQQGFCQFETERLARDGRRVPVELTLSILHDPHGANMGRSVILRDVTERQRLMEAKVQSERLATIGAMSAKLAHEIRNPLSSITLNIDLVGDEIQSLTSGAAEQGAEARSLLRSIQSEVRRIHRVTEDYLKFARLPKLYRERIGLNDIIEQGISFLESLFDASNVEVETELDVELPPILADEGQLWQAILNLVRNAIEAMPDGGRLVLRTWRDRDDVLLRISDSGCGVADDQRDQLFKPFFSTKTGGTGLGLPLTQQIVTEHGGVIECPKTPDGGTTFVIRLPIQGDETDG